MKIEDQNKDDVSQDIMLAEKPANAGETGVDLEHSLGDPNENMAYAYITFRK